MQECPFHSLPLAHGPSPSITTPLSSSSSLSSSTTAITPFAADAAVIDTLNQVADNVIGEILKLIIDADLTPSVSYVDGKGVVLRFFSADVAEEYIIPTEELRSRDPSNGLKIKDISSDELERLKTVRIKNIDFRGRYGVAFEWNDGHYADIFPYEVLRAIAVNQKQ